MVARTTQKNSMKKKKKKETQQDQLMRMEQRQIRVDQCDALLVATWPVENCAQ